MNVKVEYSLSAEKAEEILIGLRSKAHEKAIKKIEIASAFRDGYVSAILDVQDRIIRYQTAKDGGAEDV